MAIKYNGLFKVLKSKGVPMSQLEQDLNLSSATIAKFRKNKYVSLRTIEVISIYLGVPLGDILEIETINEESVLASRLKEEMSHKISGGIYHETQILLTYNSNHIEGSRLTSDQTRYIFETNTLGLDKTEIVNVDDIIETQNHFRCIDYVIQTAFEPLTEEYIKDLHKLLKNGTSDSKLDWFNVGDYKQRPNTVGGFETTRPEHVSRDMFRLIGKYEIDEVITFNKIIEFHYEFECIHPFQDGNGRVGRLVAFKECLRNNIVPFTIDEELKLFYYRGLKEWNNNRGFLVSTCEAGQEKYSRLLKVFNLIHR